MLFGSMSSPGSVSLTEPPDARFLKPELAYTPVTAVEKNHDRGWLRWQKPFRRLSAVRNTLILQPLFWGFHFQPPYL